MADTALRESRYVNAPTFARPASGAGRWSWRGRGRSTLGGRGWALWRASLGLGSWLDQLGGGTVEYRRDESVVYTTLYKMCYTVVVCCTYRACCVPYFCSM